MTTRYRGFSKTELLATIDHTFLKPEGTPEQELEVVAQARALGVKAACIRPSGLAAAKELLQDSAVLLCTVIGFPHGNVPTAVKVLETQLAVAAGAVEVDMVINPGLLVGRREAEVETDIRAVAEAAHAGGAILKVILETCYLDDITIARGCQAAVSAGADFVKTSTGFGSGGVTVEVVRLMREQVGSTVGVKASGGIRTLDKAIDMIEAGASRIGCSATVEILEEFDRVAD